MDECKNFKIFIIFLILITSVQLYFLITWDNVAFADAFSRLGIAKSFFIKGEHHRLLTQWLPGHILFLATGYGIVPDVSFVRGLSLAICATSFFPFFKLSEKYAADRIMFIFSLIFYLSFISFHLIATQTMSLGLFVCLMLWHWYYYSEYVISGENKKLIISAIFILMASSIRYEAWFFSACFNLSIWLSYFKKINKHSIEKNVAIGIISNAFILFWMIVSYRHFNDPLLGLTMSNIDTLSEYRDEGRIGSHSSMFKAYLYYLFIGSGFLVLSLPFVVAKTKSYFIKYISLCALTLICLHLLKLYNMTLKDNFRYLYALIIISFLLFSTIKLKLNRILLSILLFIPSFFIQYVSITDSQRRPRFEPINVQELSHALDRELSPLKVQNKNVMLYTDTVVRNAYLWLIPVFSFYSDFNYYNFYSFSSKLNGDIDLEEYDTYNLNYILTIAPSDIIKSESKDLNKYFILRKVATPYPYQIYEILKKRF